MISTTCCKTGTGLHRSSGDIRCCGGMPEFPFPAVAAVHGEDRFAGRANDASGAPDGGATKGSHLPEAPWRIALWGRTMRTVVP